MLTAVFVPGGPGCGRTARNHPEHFDLSLGMGLGRLKGRVFRIGHLGDTNDLTVLAALAGVEMGLDCGHCAWQRWGWCGNAVFGRMRG